MRNLMLASVFLAAAANDGCESQPQDVVVEKEKPRRIQVVEKWDEDWWTWKVLKDTETEKEWLVIHDNGDAIVVVPLDGTAPIRSVKEPDDE